VSTVAVNEVEVNINALSEDIDKLQAAVQQMDEKIKDVFDAVGELGKMWEGPEKAEFLQQIESDYGSCQEMCGILRDLISGLTYAKEEYQECEQRVKDLIEAVQI